MPYLMSLDSLQNEKPTNCKQSKEIQGSNLKQMQEETKAIWATRCPNTLGKYGRPEISEGIFDPNLEKTYLQRYVTCTDSDKLDICFNSREWICLADFPPIYQMETTFVTACILSRVTTPSEKKSTNGKEFVSQ